MVAALLLPALATTLHQASLPDGYAVLAQSQSAYGLVQVIDDRARGIRFLRADHSIVGAAYLDRPSESPFEYIDMLTSVRCLRPDARRMLLIGLGTGSLVSALRAPDVTMDIVEIDPNVVGFARQYFGLPQDAQVAVDDARQWLRRTNAQYDFIVHDTFTGGATPEHLLSLEALGTVHRLLNRGGLLVLNFVGHADDDESAAASAIAKTLRASVPRCAPVSRRIEPRRADEPRVSGVGSRNRHEHS